MISLKIENHCGYCTGVCGMSVAKAIPLGLEYYVRHHRRECLRIPRVWQIDADRWLVRYVNEDMVCGSFERAIEAALIGPPA